MRQHADFFRVFEQPPKIPFLAALVMACNLEKPELAIAVLGDVADSVQNHMRNGAWREVKLGLRLLVCLQVMLEGDGVFPVLEELFSRAVDLQTTSSEDVHDHDPMYRLSLHVV